MTYILHRIHRLGVKSISTLLPRAPLSCKVSEGSDHTAQIQDTSSYTTPISIYNRIVQHALFLPLRDCVQESIARTLLSQHFLCHSHIDDGCVCEFVYVFFPLLSISCLICPWRLFFNLWPPLIADIPPYYYILFLLLSLIVGLMKKGISQHNPHPQIPIFHFMGRRAFRTREAGKERQDDNRTNRNNHHNQPTTTNQPTKIMLR